MANGNTTFKGKKDPITGLSDKEELFCIYYVKLLSNGRAAYQAVYPKAKDTSAMVKASQWLRKDNIAMRITELKEELKKTAHLDLEQLVQASKDVYNECMKPLKVYDLKGNATGETRVADPRGADLSLRTLMQLEGFDKDKADTTAIDKLANILGSLKETANNASDGEEDEEKAIDTA